MRFDVTMLGYRPSIVTGCNSAVLSELLQRFDFLLLFGIIKEEQPCRSGGAEPI